VIEIRGKKSIEELAEVLPIQGWGSRSRIRRETLVITILIVLLVLMLVGAIPAWPHSRQWGYAPSGTLGLVLLVLLILVVTGRL
jgi:hypothetical protein